ncbi:hypothetical protein [Ferruginivarius sediminum]|uniref:hypothetical protein n=1 Tax=Ferruginivarius sediminum TaxID=2661937 RepID=UPI001F4E07EE|nr:hypothetical protein [Ferruginivarius sediminum]
MTLQEGVQVARRDPPPSANIDRAEFTVFDPAPNRGLPDLHEISDLVDCLILLVNHCERLSIEFRQICITIISLKPSRQRLSLVGLLAAVAYSANIDWEGGCDEKHPGGD